MPATHRTDKEHSGTGTAAAGIGAAALMIACCAGPALIAAGALGALGGILGNPWVITAGVLVLAAAVTTIVRRHSRRDPCCPPTASPKTLADRDDTHVAADQEGPRPR